MHQLRILTQEETSPIQAVAPPASVNLTRTAWAAMLLLWLIVALDVGTQWFVTMPALRSMENRLDILSQETLRNDKSRTEHQGKVEALRTQQLIQEAMKVGKSE